MPNYKLTYFNITGLGEPIRFILHYGGVKFEDHRITFEEWPAIKSQMPMEQVPILEIDGKVYHQTRAVSRHLAKKFGLYGSSELQSVEIDACVDDIEDFRFHVRTWFVETEPTVKEHMKKILLEKYEFFFSKLEERVKKNGGYFAGNKLSWADLHFAGLQEPIGILMEIDILSRYPALKKLNDTVRSIPKIKAYLDKRPKTKF